MFREVLLRQQLHFLTQSSCASGSPIFPIARIDPKHFSATQLTEYFYRVTLGKIKLKIHIMPASILVLLKIGIEQSLVLRIRNCSTQAINNLKVDHITCHVACSTFTPIYVNL